MAYKNASRSRLSVQDVPVKDNPIVSIIAALSLHDHCIGSQGKLPWRHRADLLRFRSLSEKKAVIMGRKTWESLPEKPLTTRLNLVWSRRVPALTRLLPDSSDNDAYLDVKDAFCSPDIERLVHCAGNWTKAQGQDEIMVIGGGQLYAELMPRAARLYLSLMDVNVENPDTFMPEINEQDFEIVREEPLETREGEPPAIWKEHHRLGT